MTKTNTQYRRHSTATIEEVVSHIAEGANRVTLQSGFGIGVSSLRMRTFARGTVDGKIHCVACGLAAQFFSVDTFTHNKPDAPPHANLFGVKEDGTEVLFTHDHILARSLGGADNLSNTQVMCSPCNSAKSVGEHKLAATPEMLEKRKAEIKRKKAARAKRLAKEKASAAS